MSLTPVAPVARLRAYAVPPPVAPCDLHLDGNEGLPADAEVLAALAGADPGLVRRYPSVKGLQRALAARHGVAAEQVLVTAGADDALDRACRALLGPGRGLVLPLPTFEMLHIYARLAQAELATVPWPGGPFPTDAVLAAITPATVAVAVVSPNNPTGAVATAGDLAVVAGRVPLVLLDHAYVEFADVDLTPAALELGNVLVFRTLSKAWGLAGLRVGYVVGPAEVVGWLRRVGLPYPVAGPSAALAEQRLTGDQGPVQAFIADVRRRRAEVEALLAPHGLAGAGSQANFVYVRTEGAAEAAAIRDGLARQAIAVRGWPDRAELAPSLRMTVACTEADHARFVDALQRVLGEVR